MITRLLCLIGRHQRSKGRARRLGDRWQSRCRRCGTQMEKPDGGAWHVIKDTPVAVPPPA